MAEGLGQVISWYICTFVALGFLITRLVVRWQRRGALGIEDWLLALAGCCLVGDLVIQHYMWTLGLAENPKTVSFENFVSMMKMIVPGSTLYVTSLWLIKLALVIFYKKIAAPDNKMQIAYNITLVFLVASWLAIFFDIMFQCYPHDKRWSTNPNYACDPRQSDINFWLTVLTNIFTDVLIICLPIAMVMKLQMKPRQKLGVAGIFMLGIFVIITSIIRAHYSYKGAQMITCTVSMIEASVAVVAACLPPLRTIILGHTTVRSSSYGKRYELSYFNNNAGGGGSSSNRKSTRIRTSTMALGSGVPGGDSVIGIGGGPGSGHHLTVTASHHHHRHLHHLHRHHHHHDIMKSLSNDSEDELVWNHPSPPQQKYLPTGGGGVAKKSTTAPSAGGGSSIEFGGDESEGGRTSLSLHRHHHQQDILELSHPSQRHHRAFVEAGPTGNGGGGGARARSSHDNGGRRSHDGRHPPVSMLGGGGGGGSNSGHQYGSHNDESSNSNDGRSMSLKSLRSLKQLSAITLSSSPPAPPPPILQPGAGVILVNTTIQMENSVCVGGGGRGDGCGKHADGVGSNSGSGCGTGVGGGNIGMLSGSSVAAAEDMRRMMR